MHEEQAVAALAALAHPLRLKLFRALVVVGPPGLTPGAIIDGIGMPAATLSFHLKELTTAGLVSQQRSGRNVIYRAAFDAMNGLVDYLTENCCQGAACSDESTSAACGC
ncbi:MAG: metalloregulator ArsR/SmtB family transcription factor [Burkholderiales bacterium]